MKFDESSAFKTQAIVQIIEPPTLQELLGMKLFALCVRTVFRDYYDIYCLLEAGCKLDEAAVYNYFLSRMYSEGVSLKRSRKSVLK